MNGNEKDVQLPDVESSSKYQTVERVIEHPLEEVFDIEPGSTVIPHEERVPAELVEHHTYDDKDEEIEEQFQEVYDYAMENFENVTSSIEGLEGKYKARNHEVSANYLNIALQAAREKQNMKSMKDKLEQASQNGPAGLASNGGVTMTHQEVLQMISQAATAQTEAKEINTIDGEYEESPTEESE
jgi:hypothetical protein